MKRTGSNSIVQRLITHNNNSHTSSLTKTTRQYFCHRNCVFNYALSNKPNLIVPNNKLYYPTTTTFGQIRSYTTTNWWREKEASTNDSDGTNTSAPSSSEPITLNLMDYESWNAQQVASVLISPKSLGGAGLSVDDVKPLYEAGFKGSSLHNIVENIKKKDEYFALKAMSGSKDFTQVSENTCQTVVFWVLDQLMTRQYSLWQLEPVSKQIIQKLGEPIAKGGADLSLDQVSSLDSKTLYSIAKDVVFGSKGESVAIDLTLEKKVVKWVKQFLLQNNIIQIELRNFDVLADYINKISSIFEHSIATWKNKTLKEEKRQKEILQDLYKSPLLPDHLNGFQEHDFKKWTSHWDSKRIPENKGEELRKLLSTDASIERGHDYGYSLLCFLDLTTSGKTYTIFNLANSTPTGKIYQKFFVLYVTYNSRIFQALANTQTQHNHSCSPETAVSLLALASHIVMKHLATRHPNITSLEFLQFIRDGGEELIVDIFNVLLQTKPKFDSQRQNVKYTDELRDLGIKVVFAFDEASTLLEIAPNTVPLSDGNKGSLFHAVYKTIHKFNNVVFLGTTYNFTKASINITGDGRAFVRTVVGTLDPWFFGNVKEILLHKFNLQTWAKQYPKLFDIICYLLAGSPYKVSLFHRHLLESNKESVTEKLMDSLDQVVTSYKNLMKDRVTTFLDDSSLVDRFDVLLTLIFGQELVFQSENVQSNGKLVSALIEKTIAPVVKVGQKKQIFEIIDPIAFATYFTHIFENNRQQVWNFVKEMICVQNGRPALGDGFETFIVLLLLEESERLDKSKLPMTQSPLFSKLKGIGDFDNYYLDLKTFIKDNVLKQSSLAQDNGIPGVWFSLFHEEYLSSNWLSNAIVKPDNQMRPDGIFFLKRGELSKHSICSLYACTLVADPVSDVTQPNKAIHSFMITDPKNIGTTKKGDTFLEGLKIDTQDNLKHLNMEDMPCLRILFCPNMDTSKLDLQFMKQNYSTIGHTRSLDDVFSAFNKNHTLLVIGASEILACLEKNRNSPGHLLRIQIWNTLCPNAPAK
ncbi:hypothetical protein C9374_005928 [Naegleria lovaniensis]|uniref:Uncharacterized protein n=1 Tax=Naegleria lovaniensis TaxID=51637 RepID=A0AA88GMX2_NAELO|nr:uncharacterized protein C9374_005928 [Naegleria lovaniensis]KAG2382136.1 hypothetical protein C9374_005928 [Naegleria lovaniensis]